MSLSVVIRTRDEADRLRLTLASLARQTLPVEVVVTDDGSRDHTPAVLAQASPDLRLVVVRHARSRGRSAASNAGARAASGDTLLFLDGDTLAHPDLARRHAEAHAQGRGRVGRGETFHLRCTRFLRDPETGAPRPEAADRIAALPAGELERLRVTRRQVLEAFETIEQRAEPGIYPGAGPRKLQALELDALRRHPDCAVIWAAATGANLSAPRQAFLEAGGFDEQVDNNEHRELALRLQRRGLRLRLVEGARTYHMTHRSGWRDPLVETAWERRFHAVHPIPEVKLLAVFWAGLAGAGAVPEQARIASLPELAAAARGRAGVDYDLVRQALGLRRLVDDPALAAP